MLIQKKTKEMSSVLIISLVFFAAQELTAQEAFDDVLNESLVPLQIDDFEAYTVYRRGSSGEALADGEIPEAEEAEEDDFLSWTLKSGLKTQFTTNAENSKGGGSDFVFNPSVSLTGEHEIKDDQQRELGKFVGAIGGSISDYEKKPNLDFSIFQGQLGYQTKTASDIGIDLNTQIVGLYSGTFDDRQITFYRVNLSGTTEFQAFSDEWSSKATLLLRQAFANPDEFARSRVELSALFSRLIFGTTIFEKRQWHVLLRPSIYGVHYYDLNDDERDDYGASFSVNLQWSQTETGASLSIGGGVKAQGSSDNDKDFAEWLIPLGINFRIPF